MIHRVLLFSATLLCVCTLFCYAGCAESEQGMTEFDSWVVLDYTDASLPPRMELAVFVQAPYIGDSLRLVSQEAQYEWLCRSVRHVSTAEGTAWHGFSHFAMPEGAPLPRGSYTLYYQAEGGDERELPFRVTYPQDCADLPLAAVQDVMSAGNAQELRAVYDGQGSLLAFSPPDDGADYAGATKTRRCYVGEGVVCFLPARAVAENEAGGN